MERKSSPRLFLLPTCLGETEPGLVLPAHYLSRIGHLRAFFVEDLRSARRFLRKIGYRTDFDEVLFVELNEHTSAESLETVLEKQGIDVSELLNQDMGILSEAGLPCIADPGSVAVEWAHRKGIQVVPLSGPSSIFLALMASGLNGQRFCFHGYLPANPKERAARLRELESLSGKYSQTQIFIETPYRSQQMFQSILDNCRGETRLCIASEITTESEFIRTRSVSQWKKHPAEIGKKNTVFLISL